jgi:glycosyltransferase involved in cell wall biosynthesis
MAYELSILVPAHNEASRLADGLRAIMDALTPAEWERTELILIDDGSTDDTAAVAQRLLVAIPHFYVIRYETNRGKGGALKVGVAAATGREVVCIDADAAILPSQLPLVRAALAAAPVAVGSRARGGRIAYDSTLRTWAGAAFNAAVRHWTKITVRDTQCGFKGYHLAAARLVAIFGLVDGFAFDVEWLTLARRLGLSVATVDVTWHDVAGSSVRVGRDSVTMLREIRRLARTDYRTVGVHVAPGQSTEALDALCRQARVQGGVVARGATSDTVVLPRDAATAAIGVAEALGGTLCVVTPEDLCGRVFDAI